MCLDSLQVLGSGSSRMRRPRPPFSRPRASCLTDPRSVACCAEIPPEWDSDGAGREHGISGNITIPKSYNELATLMSVTGALPAASFRLAGGIQRLQAGRARLRERRVGKQQAGRLLSARCCLAPTFPRMITITSCSCCCGFFRRGCDSPPVLPRHPPGVWLRRPHRHAHLLLPRGCLDRWGPRGVLLCLAGPPKECLGCRSTMPGSACCWQAVPAPGWGNGHACPLLRPRLPLLATLYPCSWERNLFGRLCAHAAHRRLPGSAGGPGDGGHCSGAWRGQQRVSPWQAGFHAGQLLGMRLIGTASAPARGTTACWLALRAGPLMAPLPPGNRRRPLCWAAFSHILLHALSPAAPQRTTGRVPAAQPLGVD